jgi:hypothetical protein
VVATITDVITAADLMSASMDVDKVAPDHVILGSKPLTLARVHR